MWNQKKAPGLGLTLGVAAAAGAALVGLYKLSSWAKEDNPGEIRLGGLKRGVCIRKGSEPKTFEVRCGSAWQNDEAETIEASAEREAELELTLSDEGQLIAKA